MHKLGIGLAVLFVLLGVVYVAAPVVLWHIGSILTGLGTVALVLAILWSCTYVMSRIDRKYGYGASILVFFIAPLVLRALHCLGQAILSNYL